MKEFEALTTAGQVRRLRKLAVAALAAYDLEPVRLWPLHHGHNTTFGVETAPRSGARQRYVLRTSWPGWRLVPHLEAELAFLRILRDETDLIAPTPVTTRSGTQYTKARASGVPGERQCALFEWIDGQLFRRRQSPTGMERVGRFTADLHNFTVAQHERLSGLARPSVQWERRAGHDGDMDRVMREAFQSDGSLLPLERRNLFLSARARVEATMEALGWAPADHGLIHADLHMGNLLHHRGTIRAIDFDDLGWGHYLYDLAVTQWYIRRRPDFAELSAAHLRGYRQRRPLPADREALIPTFMVARTLMMACYIAGRADHPRFRRWAPEFVGERAAEIEEFLVA
jgi:Ser/Thr protein kinase RdoA (MazF antagonist)